MAEAEKGETGLQSDSSIDRNKTTNCIGRVLARESSRPFAITALLRLLLQRTRVSYKQLATSSLSWPATLRVQCRKRAVFSKDFQERTKAKQKL